MTTRFRLPGIAGLLVVLSTGCMSFSDRGFDPVTEEIGRQAPQVHLRKEFAVSIGFLLKTTPI